MKQFQVLASLWYLSHMGQINRLLGNLKEAADAYVKMKNRDNDSLEAHVGLAGIMIQQGRLKEAEHEASEALRINPEFSVCRYVDNLIYRDPDVKKKIAEELKLAGLPE
ncbi:MAG: tetratricopeptide repeat protein [Gammaproteobacteria bacterium]|nr:tetratricopeptide repeat protein [Gammaproteobacteria bacterium]